MNGLQAGTLSFQVSDYPAYVAQPSTLYNRAC
jgi:hypothetical protein